MKIKSLNNKKFINMVYGIVPKPYFIVYFQEKIHNSNLLILEKFYLVLYYHVSRVFTLFGR